MWEEKNVLNFTEATPTSMRGQIATELFGPGSGGAFLTYSEIMMKYNKDESAKKWEKYKTENHEEMDEFFKPDFPIIYL